LVLSKLGATATLLAGDEKVIVQTAIRVTWRKST